MTPTDTVDYELVNFLSASLQEASVVLAVVVVVGITLLSLSSPLIDVGVFTFVVILVQRSQETNDAFKEEQDEVETVNLELLKVGSSEVPLILELGHEIRLLIKPLYVLDDADLLARVDRLVVLKQLLNKFLEDALLRGVFRLGYE